MYYRNAVTVFSLFREGANLMLKYRGIEQEANA